jgi:hypothetical protein
MVRFVYRSLLIASALLAAPASAQEPAGYTLIGASHARVNYNYLTMEAVTKKVKPDVAAQLPPDGRLVILNVNFRSLGNPSKMVRLDPAELQVQWEGGGAAPVLGAHISKDFWAMAGGGFYTSMRPDKYELFVIVPRTARALDLAQRQPDGSYKLVKARIALAGVR